MPRPILATPPWRSLAAAILAVTAAGSVRADACLAVEVEQVRPQQGALMLAAFDAPERFGREPLAVLRVPAGDATTRFTWCLPESARRGEVAITLFQDLDGDGKMGRTLLGVPTEPWGASGQPGPFGPDWATTRVPLPAEGRALVLRLVP